jgi:NAD(P)-dependent dehydrogenase (short-subunit alcohol dehydrogenase family)
MPSVLVTGAVRGIGRAIVVPTDKVVAVVDEALTARHPRARYQVGVGPRLQAAVITKLPTDLRDQMMATLVGLPRRGSG